jgi:hypothetical protein|tara:strand:- start:587 stop:820 length:234 start_codon:yes stop_codon:yes gene_type:complete
MLCLFTSKIENNIMLLEEKRGPMGEQRLLDLVRASQASDFVPEQERNFDMGVMPANTSPYVYRGTEVIDGKTYRVYS